MNTNDVKGNSGNIWQVASDLTVYTADNLRQQLLESLSNSCLPVLDLSAVNACDCAGLQLLCSYHKSAHQLNKTVHACKLSPAITKAAEDIGVNLCELFDSILPD